MDDQQQGEHRAFEHETIAILAHQLRTSLAATKWILKMFIDGDVGELSAEQKGFIEKAFTANERMISLVSEMLALSKVEDGKDTLNTTEANVVNLIDDALFDFTSESYKRGIEVIFLRPPEAVPNAFFDFGKMRFVVQNLIENAIKYSDKGDRVVIAIERHDGDEIEVSVKDTGIGIPETEQPKIFDKYYRADNARKKEEMGTGLGLFTAKHIVERHGGKMWFESKPDIGTTFYFTLPLKKGGGMHGVSMV